MKDSHCRKTLQGPPTTEEILDVSYRSLTGVDFSEIFYRERKFLRSSKPFFRLTTFQRSFIDRSSFKELVWTQDLSKILYRQMSFQRAFVNRNPSRSLQKQENFQKSFIDMPSFRELLLTKDLSKILYGQKIFRRAFINRNHFRSFQNKIFQKVLADRRNSKKFFWRLSKDRRSLICWIDIITYKGLTWTTDLLRVPSGPKVLYRTFMRRKSCERSSENLFYGQCEGVHIFNEEKISQRSFKDRNPSERLYKQKTFNADKTLYCCSIEAF